MTALFKLTIASHHFVVSNVAVSTARVITEFSRKFVQFGFVRESGRNIRTALKVYAAATDSRSEYRFHINALRDFREHLDTCNISKLNVEEVVRPTYETDHVDFIVKPQWVAREDQIPLVDYLVKKGDPKSRLVSLQTGKGKSFVTMLSMSKICKRTVVIVKPGYMEKWVSDFVKTYEIGPEDVMVVTGGAQLMALLALQEAGDLTQNLIVISNKTYQNWLTLYEANGSRIRDMGYACLPDELFEFLRAGVRLVDETHQDFHLNFKMDMYTHVPLSISLSATLITNDAFMQRMYELMFPMADRAPVPPLDKYIRAIGLVYRMKPGRERFVKTSEYGSTSYSHLAFEKSIMKSESLQDSYFEAIKFSLDATYIKKYVKGDKFIVFAATIELCTRIRDYLKDEYPSLNIRKYTSGDPMTHLLESDGVVSTLGSAGTAHDIPGLTTVVQTTSIDSPQANVQSFGRLRKIAGRDVDFVFFSCVDISKQMQYFERKKHILLDRAASFRTVNLPFMV